MHPKRQVDLIMAHLQFQNVLYIDTLRWKEGQYWPVLLNRTLKQVRKTSHMLLEFIHIIEERRLVNILLGHSNGPVCKITEYLISIIRGGSGCA